MEPEQTLSESDSRPDSAFKKYFCQVTQLSKYFAFVLFIILPFIGGYVGYVYAPEKVVEVEKVVEIEKNVEVGNDDGVDDDKKPTLEDLVSCYDSKDYYLIESLVDVVDKNIFTYIIKTKDNYPVYYPTDPRYQPQDYFHDCLQVYKEGVREDDIVLEKQGPNYSVLFANNRIYFNSGTDKIRHFEVYDLAKENYVLEDGAWNLDEMETSADFVRYWSVAKSVYGPDTEFTGVCLGVEDHVFYGELAYVEYNFETGEEIVLDEKCI